MPVHFRRQRRCLPNVLLAVMVGLVPMAALLWITYERAIVRSEDSLKRLVHAGVTRFDNVLNTASQVLMQLDNETGGQLRDDTAQLLRETAYNAPYFREIGLVDSQGRLVCTSLGPTEPPLELPADPRIDHSRKQVQIIGVVKTALMNASSIVVSLPTTGRGEINVLIDPRVLTELFDLFPLGPNGYVVFSLPNGDVLASYGTADPTAAPPVSENDRCVRIEQKTDRFNVNVTASMTNAWALQEWFDHLKIIVPVGLICSAGLGFLVLRLTRPTGGLKAELEIALRNNEFEAHYQPTIDLTTSRCTGAEALIRWKHPEQGYVRPDLFIAVAEESGLIDDITRWLMKRVVHDVGDLLKTNGDLHIGINLAPAQFTSQWLLPTLRDTYREGLVPPRQIMLEATERSVMEGGNGAVTEVMKTLRDMGFGVALDDFGTGYSSLGSLHQFKFDYLKIDASFVRRIGTDNVSSGVIDAIIDLGKTLKMHMIAEGVETAAQRDYLKSHGVHFAQGWLYAKAMPPAEFHKFVATANGRSGA